MDWIAGGDYNMTPQENAFPMLLTGRCFEFAASGQPTRWQGNRCIDYFMSNMAHGTPTTPALVLADHMLQSLKLRFDVKRVTRYEIAPCPQIPVYEGSSRSWNAAVEKHWKAAKRNLPDFGNQPMDEDWAALSKALFESIANAQKELDPASMRRVPAALLRRGKPVQVRIRQKESLRRPVAGCLATFQERCLSNLLARLHEAIRHEQIENPNEIHRRAKQDLWKRIRRSPHYDSNKTLHQNVYKVETALAACSAAGDRTRLNKWNDKMQNDKKALRWLRQDLQASHPCVKVDPDSEPGDTVQASLSNLKTFWTRIWDRHTPHIDDFWTEFVAETPAHVPMVQTPQVSVEQLRAAAQQAAGTAPGVDGWRAEELLRLSDNMWETVLNFYALCQEAGEIPTAWRTMRQVHIPKGKEPDPDGAQADQLRPIVVESMWWRVLNSALFHHPETQQWLHRVMPPWVFGGIRHRGPEDAIAPLLLKDMKQWFLATLDLTKAFDFTDPMLISRVLTHLGMATNTVRLLQSAWTRQRRFLQYMGETLPEAAHVSTSLPQGDVWSMLGMTCALLPVSHRIAQRYPRAVQALFADDRSFATPTIDMALQIRDIWHTWMHRLGLVENVGKEQLFHRAKGMRNKMVQQGLPATSVNPNTVILGFHMMPAQRRKAVGKEVTRTNKAKLRTHRCRCLPGSRERQKRLGRMIIPPAAAWGMICRQPTKKETKDFFTLAKQFHDWPKQAAVPLLKIVVGHMWDLSLASASTSLRILIRHFKFTGNALPQWPRALSGWTGSFRTAMDNCGFRETGPWQWTNDGAGPISLRPDDLRHMRDPNQQLQHRLREGWRFDNFQQWLDSDRRDAAACQHVRITDPNWHSSTVPLL
eukprot:s307_g17.t2